MSASPDAEARISPWQAFHMVIAEERSEFAQPLEAATRGLPIEVVRVSPRDLWVLPGLDAIHVSIPMAEQWGARPSLYTLQFLPTTARDQAEGLPRLVIAGYAKDVRDQRTGLELLKSALDVTFDELERFNRDAEQPVCRVGFISKHLLVDELGGAVVGDQLREQFARRGWRPE